jgi:IS1 family transposase
MLPRLGSRDSRTARELLEKLLPERVGYEAVNPEAAYRALAEAKHRLRERQHPLMQFVSG